MSQPNDRGPGGTPEATVPEASPETAVQSHSRAKKLLRILAWTSAGLIALFTLATGALVFSNSLSAIVVRKGLAIYTDMIPGDVRVDEVEGNLWSGLQLKRLKLDDQLGQTLAEAELVELQVDLAPLLSGRVHAHGLRIEDATVYLPAQDGGGFGDLAPPDDGSPAVASVPGPSLPIVLDAELDLVRVVIRQAGAPDHPALADVESLHARLDGSGRQLSLDLDLAASMPGQGLVVDALKVRANWDTARLSLDEMSMRSNWGSFDLAPSYVDFAPEASLEAQVDAGALGELELTALAEPLDQFTGLRATGPAQLSVSGSADRESANATLALKVPGAIDAKLKTLVVLGDKPHVEVQGDIAMTLRGLSSEFAERTVHIETQLDAKRLRPDDPTKPDEAELALTGELRCDDCDPARTPTRVKLDASYRPADQSGKVQAHATIADATLDLDASLDAQGAYVATVDLNAASLRGVWKVANGLAPLPAFAGEAQLHLTCVGQTTPASGSCETQLRLDRGQPLSRIRLDAKASYGEVYALDIAELEVRGEGVDLRLVTPEAHIEFDPKQSAFSFERIDLALAHQRSAAAGRIKLDGNWSMGEAAPDQHVEASLIGVDLSAVNAFAPGLALGGRVSAKLNLRGTANEPRFDLSVDAKRLRYHQEAVGDLHASGSYRAREAQLQVRYTGALAETLRLHARVPVELTLSGEPPQLLSDAPAHVDLTLKGLELRRVTELARVKLALDGQLDAQLDLGGSLERPRLTLESQVHRIRFEERSLGEVQVAGSLQRSLVVASIDWKHPAWRTFKLDATTRVSLNARKLRGGLRPSADDRISLQIDGLALDHLPELIPERVGPLPVLGGRVDLRLAVTTPWRQPKLDGQLDGFKLSYNERPIGRLRLEFEYADKLLEALLSVTGPDVGVAAVKARVPLILSLADPQFQWLRDDEHHLELVSSGTDLRAIDRWAPERLFLSGQADLRASVQGKLREPVIGLQLDVDELGYGEHRVGDLVVRAQYGAAEPVVSGLPKAKPPASPDPAATSRNASHYAHAEMSLVSDPQRRIDASASVPLVVDLDRVSVQWDRSAAHRLQLIAPHLDDQLIAPFVELPEGFTFDIGTQIDLEGSLDRFDARWAVEGHAQQRDRRLPVALTLDADAKQQALELQIGDTTRPWLSVHAETRAGVAKLVTGESQFADVPIEAQIESRDFDLAQLDAILPRAIQRLEGEANLLAAVDGSLRAPQLSGSLELQGGGLTIVPLRQRFTNISIGAQFKRDRLTLSELTMQSGQGTLMGSGEAVIVDGRSVEIDLDLVARAVPVRRPGLPRMKVSAQVDTHTRLSAKGRQVDVAIEGARVDIEEGNVAAPESIPQNERVHFVLLGDDQPAWASHSDASDKQAATPPASGPPFALRVRLLDPLQVVGPAIDMSWGGAVAARSTKDSAEAQGALKCTNGHFNLLGNDFTISTGSVTLPDGGGLMPYIDLTAGTEVDGVKITATVRGPVERPTLTLSSQPTHSESDIFTMLVTGSADVDSADPEEVKARAASVLAALSTPGLQAELANALEVDKVGLTFGESTDQPILSVGKQLTKRVYAETQHHFNAPPNKNSSQLSLRYRFAPRWSLETFLGDAAVGGADIFWGVSFDGRLSSALDQAKAEDESEVESMPDDPDDPADPSEDGPGAEKAVPDLSDGDAEASGSSDDEIPLPDLEPSDPVPPDTASASDARTHVEAETAR